MLEHILWEKHDEKIFTVVSFLLLSISILAKIEVTSLQSNRLFVELILILKILYHLGDSEQTVTEYAMNRTGLYFR